MARITRTALAAALLAASTTGAAAQGRDAVADMANALVELYLPIAGLRAATALCLEAAPEALAAAAPALAAWRDRNAVEDTEDEIRWFLRNAPVLAEPMARVATVTADLVRSGAGSDPAGWCAGLPDLVAGPALNLGPAVRPALDRVEAARDLLADSLASEVRADPPVEPRTVLTAAQVAWLAGRAADAFPEGARNDDVEMGVVEAAQALGTFAVTGIVEDDDELRFVTPDGERQSTFGVGCHRFVDEPTEDRFAGMVGRPVAVAGRPDGFHPSSGLWLDRCAIVDAGGLPASPLEEALEWRPPSEAEAAAGPGEGFDTKAIEAVLFHEDARAMLDGFGNFYTISTVRVWLLLSDGTAYLHGWPFPPQDVDIDLVRRRQPDRWARWEAEGDGYVLLHADGSREDLAGFTRVGPFPGGTTLDRTYTHLSVGPGYHTRRSFTFRPDGTFSFGSGGLVAMQGPPVAGGDIGVTAGGTSFTGGALGSMVGSVIRGEDTSGRYAIDGWVLTLDTDRARERVFIGRPSGDENPGGPDFLFLEGEMYWLPDD